MQKTNPIFIPANMDQLDAMVGGLKKGLNKHFKFTPNSTQKLRDVVLSTLLISDGVQEWDGILNQRLNLPKTQVCNVCKQLLPDEIWVATDCNLDFLGVYFMAPEHVELCGDETKADLMIRNARDAIYDDEPVGDKPFESEYWAYIANMFRVDEMSVIMPNISKYGVPPQATDAGGLEFLKDNLWLEHINDELCIDPIDRQDDGSDNIWLKLTRI